MKRKLAESNEELTQIYEELTASDEEMKQQYNEMIEINEKLRLGEDKLAYLAYYDSLTGLMNKDSLNEKTRKLLRQSNDKIALICIDVDNFKNINDTMGHAYGDQILIKVGKKLQSLLHQNCSIYRLGGDEFVLLVEEINKIEDLQNYVSQLLTKFSDDCETIGNINVSLSMGIAIYPEHGDHLEELMKNADIAMYRAKASGKKSYVIYNHLMSEELAERITIEKYLKKGLEFNEFEIYYQPQLDLKSNRISGFEALLRWKSPEMGNVSPLKFIKAAEDTHFIIPLGTWVLQNACEFLSRLIEKGYEGLVISVNISILQLIQNDFYHVVNDTLIEQNLDPRYLELEITESILAESFDIIVPRLKMLRDHKVRVALDDFGKGYSSLNYLKQLPITTLKVDKPSLIISQMKKGIP